MLMHGLSWEGNPEDKQEVPLLQKDMAARGAVLYPRTSPVASGKALELRELILFCFQVKINKTHQ